jgi:hypothetical protein
LKKYNVEEEKVLILITSLMTWNQTPKNLKEIKDGKIVEDIPVEGGEGAENGELPALEKTKREDLLMN